MLKINADEVRHRANEEFRNEEFRRLVEIERARLRNRATLWARIRGLMPFTIKRKLK